MLFVNDLDNKGAKGKPFKMTFAELFEDIDTEYSEGIGSGQPPNTHERLTGAVIPYIDFDSFEPEELRIPNAKKIVKAIKSVFGDDADILMADRSGFSARHNKYKLSLRAYIRGVGYFSSTNAALKFMLEKFKPLLGEALDGNAYKTNQNMGLLFNTKKGDNRILQPMNSEFERIPWSFDIEQSDYLKKSLIQNIEGETIRLDNETIDENISQSVKVVQSDSIIEGVFKTCLKLMPNLIIKKVIDKKDYFLIEFKKCPDECPICKRTHTGNRQYATYYPNDNRAFFKCHDTDAKGKKINLVLPEAVRTIEEIKSFLPNNCEEESDVEEAEFNESVKIKTINSVVLQNQKNTFDYNDPYTYSDFYNQYKSKDTKDVLNDVINDATKVIAHITQGKGFYIKKLKNGTLDIVGDLGSSSFKLTDHKSSIKIEDVIKASSIKSYGNIKCILDDSCDYDDFNLWTGFQAKRVDISIESEGLKAMKLFIMESWANNNMEHYNYIISWFAGLFTNLSGINRVALAMVSPQGTGKGTLLEFMELLLRRNNISTVNGVSEITGKFNILLQNKRLININEMCSTQNEFRANFEKIKGFITDPLMRIEPKGINPYFISNIGNLIMFTNHRDSLIIEESDRRYAIFEMGVSHLNDTKYFTNLRKQCFNQDVANEFYTYLLDFQAVDISKIIDTELKREMKQMSKPSVNKFIDSIFADEDYKENIFHGEPIKAIQLYTSYKTWCNDNGERNIVTNTKFGSFVDDRIIKTRTNRGIMYAIA
jgi:hypothetical protein